MKKLCALFLALALTLALVACGGNSGNSGGGSTGGNTGSSSDAGNSGGGDDAGASAGGEQVGAGKTVGIAMPTQSSERWINDGANMKAQLEALGYTVQLQYAEDDPQVQINQIENMICQEVDCIVIASVDSVALTVVEAQAKEAGIPVIAYYRLVLFSVGF